MEHPDPYTTHNSSPDMSDDEDDVQWDDNELDLDNPMQVTATPAGPSTSTSSTAIYPAHNTLSTASSSSSSLNQPAPAHAVKRKHNIGSRKVSKTGSSAGNKEFTSKMKDRQARGKEYEFMSTDDESSSDAFNAHSKNPYSPESHETKSRRRLAAVILDNPELLMMHAQARSDSIPGTRNYFMKILCGYQEPGNEWPFVAKFQEKKDKEKKAGGEGRRVSGRS